jgi:hypothetical protein
MAKTLVQLDFEKPFPERYLACAHALSQLEHWLMVVGMSGNREFELLRRNFIAHGAVTFLDMNRQSPHDIASQDRA